jgi:hypothetical protein
VVDFNAFVTSTQSIMPIKYFGSGLVEGGPQYSQEIDDTLCPFPACRVKARSCDKSLLRNESILYF